MGDASFLSDPGTTLNHDELEWRPGRVARDERGRCNALLLETESRVGTAEATEASSGASATEASGATAAAEATEASGATRVPLGLARPVAIAGARANPGNSPADPSPDAPPLG